MKNNRIHDNKLLLRRLFLLAYDIGAIVIASALALLLRHDFNYKVVNLEFIESVWTYLPFNIVATLLVFYIFRLYHSLWAFAGVVEMQNVITACILTSGVQMAGMLLLELRIPRSF